MRKRKESHDGTPVVDTNILFVPSSAEDPSALGVEGLMGMIDEAGAATTPAPPPEVPPSEARTEVMDAIVSPSTTQPVMMPPSFPPILATHPGPAPASPMPPPGPMVETLMARMVEMFSLFFLKILVFSDEWLWSLEGRRAFHTRSTR